MKFIVLCLLGVVVMAMANPPTHERGCRYIMGKCVEGCPEGTHAYSTGCSRRLPEATCEDPTPVLEEGILCDYSSCHCDPPTVRDAVSKKCIKLEDCPKK